MPSYIATQMQITISRALGALRSERDLPSWYHIYVTDEALIECLEAWQGKLRLLYSVAEVVDHTMKFAHTHDDAFLNGVGKTREWRGCHIEREYWGVTGALWPPKSMAQVLGLSFPHDYRDLAHSKKAAKHVRQKWALNVTLLDDWVKATAGTLESAIVFDPFQMMDELYEYTGLPAPKDTTSLYEYVAPFFLKVAQSLRNFRNRFKCEFILGEVTEILESMRHGIINRPQDFARVYDRVHLSNIP